MRLEDFIYSLSTLNIASSFLSPFWSIKRSTSFLNNCNCCATAVFNTVMGLAQLVLDPTPLISNLLPVKANGEVLLRSVLSMSISGILPTTLSLSSVFSWGDNLPKDTPSNSSNTAESCFPINIEKMAGGASLAPNLWSLLAEAIDALNSDS